MPKRKRVKQLKTRRFGSEPRASELTVRYDPSIIRPNAHPKTRKRKTCKRDGNQTPPERKALLLQDGYDAYLKSAHWLAVKQRYRQSDLPQICIVCGDPKFDLHHQTYARLGQERLTDLAPLCRICHEAVHAYERRHDKTKLRRAATAYKRHALRVVADGPERAERLREFGWEYARR